MYIEDQIKQLEEKIQNMSAEIDYLKAKSAEEILTPQEFARLTKINLNTVYTWVREGRIKTLPNLGTAIRIPMSQFYQDNANDNPKIVNFKATKAEELRAEFIKMQQANR